MVISRFTALFTLIFIFQLIFCTVNLKAQQSIEDVIGEIEARRGLVLTKEARDLITRSIVRKRASTESYVLPESPYPNLAPDHSPNSSIAIDRREEQAFDGVTGSKYFFDYAKEIADIHVLVKPTPPRDYMVFINGARYDASKLSKYGYPPGPVEVIVRRVGKKDCIFRGYLTMMGYEMKCQM